MTCNYCTPNKHGNRKALGFDTYPLREHHGGPSLNRYKKNSLRIYRERAKKRKYFMGYHSRDFANGSMTRNNGFKFTREINFCPMCGRDLKVGGCQ